MPEAARIMGDVSARIGLVGGDVMGVMARLSGAGFSRTSSQLCIPQRSAWINE
jgi:hypothetical protein